jgi:WD40 repeat protein
VTSQQPARRHARRQSEGGKGGREGPLQHGHSSVGTLSAFEGDAASVPGYTMGKQSGAVVDKMQGYTTGKQSGTAVDKVQGYTVDKVQGYTMGKQSGAAVDEVQRYTVGKQSGAAVDKVQGYTMGKQSGAAVAGGGICWRLVRPLQLAASLGDAQCAAALIAGGARRSAPADMPPLVCAAAGGHALVVSTLLRHGVDPLSCDARGATALHFAAARGHLEVCRILVAAVNVIQEDEAAGERAAFQAAACCVLGTPVSMLASMCQFLGGGRRLISSSSSGGGLSLDGDRQLSSTQPISGGGGGLWSRALEPMLIDAPDANGQSALYAACAEGHYQVVEVLLSAGAHAAARFPPDGTTLLHVAAAFDRNRVLALLLELLDGNAAQVGSEPALDGVTVSDQSHVGVDARDTLGRTPLYMAAAAGASGAAELLMAAGADCDAAPGPTSGHGRSDSASGGGGGRRSTGVHYGQTVSGGGSGGGGGNDEASDAHHAPPIVIAARRGDMRMVQDFVLHGADARPVEVLGVPLLPTPTDFHECTTLRGHTAGVTAVAFHPADSAICATVSEDGALRVHHEAPDDGSRRWELGVSFRCHAPAGGGGGGGVHSGQTIRSGGATHLAWSGEGSTIATSGVDGRCCLWTLPKVSRGPTLVMECGGAVTGVCWSPDDRRLLAARGSALLVFDVGTGDQIGQMRRWAPAAAAADVGGYTTSKQSEAAADVLCCSHARHRPTAAATSSAGVVTLWDSQTGQCLKAMWGHGSALQPPGQQQGVGSSSLQAAAPDSARTDDHPPLAPAARRLDRRHGSNGGDGGNIQFAGVRCGQAVRGGGGGGGGGGSGLTAVRGCHFTPDDRYLTTCDGGGGVRVWDVNNQVCVASWQAHGGGGAADSRFSPDGLWVATAGGDGTCRLWDPGTGKELTCLRTAGDVGFSSCAFSSSVRS